MHMYMNMNECTIMCKQHQTTSTMTTYDQISFGWLRHDKAIKDYPKLWQFQSLHSCCRRAWAPSGPPCTTDYLSVSGWSARTGQHLVDSCGQHALMIVAVICRHDAKWPYGQLPPFAPLLEEFDGITIIIIIINNNINNTIIMGMTIVFF